MSRSKNHPTHLGAPCRPAGLIIFVVLALGLLLTQAALAADTANTWTITGSLAIARNGHTATLLPNGQVLVAGGENASYGGYELDSAELYDPAAGTWRATGSLHTPRASHTATLLANGMVLVTGGANDYAAPLTSAELYDPAAGTWTITGSLTTGRCFHLATLLANGQVLVAGGYYGYGVATASAELYDPAAGTWRATGSLHTPLVSHTATRLSNGKVLVAGGWNAGSSVTSAEVYDPAAGTWTNTGSLNTGRYAHTANLLRSGLVLVVGGFNISSYSHLASAELYDPAAGTWTYTGSLTHDRSSHTHTLLNNGMVLVAGGAGDIGGVLASANLYDSAAGTWTATGSLNTVRHGHTATLLASGQVLAAGGYDNSWYLASAELYHPSPGKLEVSIDIKPGSADNSINPKSHGKVPVAILSAPNFDASSQVDRTSLTFGRTGDEDSLAFCTVKDVNRDGLLDLVGHFYTEATGFKAGDTRGILKGKTTEGIPLEGTDSVRIVPQKKCSVSNRR